MVEGGRRHGNLVGVDGRAAVSFDTVSSADSLVLAGVVVRRVASTTSFGDYVTTSGVPSDPVPRPSEAGTASTFTPSSSKFTWVAPLRVQGLVATGLAAQNTDVLFQVTESMKPSSVLLVYSPGMERTTIPPSWPALRALRHHQQAHMSQNLTVSLSSRRFVQAQSDLRDACEAVGSKVYVLAYDTAVAIQAGGISSALTKDRVIAATSPTKSAAAGSSCYPQPTSIRTRSPW